LLNNSSNPRVIRILPPVYFLEHMGKRVDLGEPHTYVAGLKPRNLVYEVADSRVVGLRIVVQPTGFKSW
jgi:hypothetical protein